MPILDDLWPDFSLHFWYAINNPDGWLPTYTQTLAKAYAAGGLTDAVNEAAEDWAQTNAGSLIRNINNYQTEAVRRIVAQAFVNGDDDATVAKKVAHIVGLLPNDATQVNVYAQGLKNAGITGARYDSLLQRFQDQLRYQRAMTIARTEMSNAMHNGQLDAWSDLQATGAIPANVQREWVLHPSERNCTTCVALDGKRIGIEGTYGPVNSPPLHPNCECTEKLVGNYDIKKVELRKFHFDVNEARNWHGRWTTSGNVGADANLKHLARSKPVEPGYHSYLGRDGKFYDVWRDSRDKKWHATSVEHVGEDEKEGSLREEKWKTDTKDQLMAYLDNAAGRRASHLGISEPLPDEEQRKVTQPPRVAHVKVPKIMAPLVGKKGMDANGFELQPNGVPIFNDRTRELIRQGKAPVGYHADKEEPTEIYHNAESVEKARLANEKAKEAGKPYYEDKDLPKVGDFKAYKPTAFGQDAAKRINATHQAKANFKGMAPTGWQMIVHDDFDKSDRNHNHPQAVFWDSQGRAQRAYDDEYKQSKESDKFQRHAELSKHMPFLTREIEKDASHNEDAKVLLLLRHMGMRPDNGTDPRVKKAEPTFGATTLQYRHVKLLANGGVQFEFVPGKAYKPIKIKTYEPSIRKMIEGKLSQDHKGTEELFPTVTPRTAEKYFHQKVPVAFKVKDLRTYRSNEIARDEILKRPAPKSYEAFVKARQDVAEAESEKIGHAPGEALVSYIDRQQFQNWWKPEWDVLDAAQKPNKQVNPFLNSKVVET